MNATEIQTALDEIFDEALIFHSYTSYMRDYEMLIYVHAPVGSGVQPRDLRYLFKYCVLAHVDTALRAEGWRSSLDERLIDYQTGTDLDGYVWGVDWQCLYPGGKIVPDSATAERWSTSVGIDFHEVRIETNGHDLTLVFSDLEVTEVPVGYSPFTVQADA